jgi:ABC-type uncharacterized transport system substrate-binding protein
MMKRRAFIMLLGGAAVAWPLAARAQQPSRVWRIGILHGVPAEASVGVSAFRQRLGELGYVEGQTTQRVPIVVAAFTDDPVAAGLIDSLGHPGGNVTGLALFAPEMSAKRLELLRDIVPHLRRVAVLWTGQSADHPALLRAADQAAHQLDIELVQIEVSGPNDIENAFDLIMRERVGAVAALQGVEFYRIRARIAELGLKHRMPIITGEDGFARLGGLVQYGPSLAEIWRQAAEYVDKILKGSEPADLPVQQPTKIELVINLKTARVLDIAVPPILLARADEVIE